MNSSAESGADLRVTAWWPGAGPWRIGAVSALVVAVVGLLTLAAGVLTEAPSASIYVSAVAICTNSIAIGYILGIARFAQVAIRRDLKRLQPVLTETVEAVYARLSAPRRPVVLVVATVTGLAIGVLVSGDTLPRLLAGEHEARLFAWTLVLLPLLWALILHVFCLMLDLAASMYRLARHALRLDFRQRERLDAFASNGVRHLLLIVIGLAVIPLQVILTGELGIWDFVPALAVSIPVALTLLMVPILGAHRTLVEMKCRELDRIDADSVAAPRNSDRALLLHLYRCEVARSSEWPVSVGGLARVVAYALVPPLAWTAAAVVERWVSALLE